jgi:L-iditol 2-dehydrogenase
MKAWVLHDIGDLRFEDAPMPSLNPGEALVRVSRAGVCSSDVSRILTSGAYHYPIILGHEFSGTVEREYDDGDVARWLGKRVGVFPLVPCFNCVSCRHGKYETCDNYSYIGSRRNGAFAEYVAVPKWNLIELPDVMSFDEAALLEPAAVALHSVRRPDLAGIGSVAVVGTGPIGRLIVRWLQIFGITDVTSIGREYSPSRQFDVCVEAVGSVEALRSCVDLTRPNGRLVLVGNPTADFNVDQRLYWQILRKQLTVRGSWNSSFPSDWRDAIAHAEQLRLSAFVSHSCGFTGLRDAVAMMQAGNVKRGKVLLNVEITDVHV